MKSFDQKETITEGQSINWKDMIEWLPEEYEPLMEHITWLKLLLDNEFNTYEELLDALQKWFLLIDDLDMELEKKDRLSTKYTSLLNLIKNTWSDFNTLMQWEILPSMFFSYLCYVYSKLLFDNKEYYDFEKFKPYLQDKDIVQSFLDWEVNYKNTNLIDWIPILLKRWITYDKFISYNNIYKEILTKSKDDPNHNLKFWFLPTIREIHDYSESHVKSKLTDEEFLSFIYSSLTNRVKDKEFNISIDRLKSAFDFNYEDNNIEQLDDNTLYNVRLFPENYISTLSEEDKTFFNTCCRNILKTVKTKYFEWDSSDILQKMSARITSFNFAWFDVNLSEVITKDEREDLIKKISKENIEDSKPLLSYLKDDPTFVSMLLTIVDQYEFNFTWEKIDKISGVDFYFRKDYYRYPDDLDSFKFISDIAETMDSSSLKLWIFNKNEELLSQLSTALDEYIIEKEKWPRQANHVFRLFSVIQSLPLPTYVLEGWQQKLLELEEIYTEILSEDITIDKDESSFYSGNDIYTLFVQRIEDIITVSKKHDFELDLEETKSTYIYNENWEHQIRHEDESWKVTNRNISLKWDDWESKRDKNTYVCLTLSSDPMCFSYVSSKLFMDLLKKQELQSVFNRAEHERAEENKNTGTLEKFDLPKNFSYLTLIPQSHDRVISHMLVWALRVKQNILNTYNWSKDEWVHFTDSPNAIIQKTIDKMNWKWTLYLNIPTHGSDAWLSFWDTNFTTDKMIELVENNPKMKFIYSTPACFWWNMREKLLEESNKNPDLKSRLSIFFQTQSDMLNYWEHWGWWIDSTFYDKMLVKWLKRFNHYWKAVKFANKQSKEIRKLDPTWIINWKTVSVQKGQQNWIWDA